MDTTGTNAFEVCGSRFYDPDGGGIFGCLNNALDGHGEQSGIVHRNGEYWWASTAGIKAADRCPSLHSPARAAPCRCIEDVGHYPASVHVKTGYPPISWTDEMSDNPPGAVMVDPNPVLDIPDEEQAGYPVGRQLEDLRKMLDSRHVRQDALHHARKSWTAACDVNVADYIQSALRIAQAFEQFLLDGTVPPAPADRQPLEAPPTPVASRKKPDSLTQSTGLTSRQLRNDIVAAAVIWVEDAHVNNSAGPDNWRAWADEKDINLINRVLAYLGMPLIDQEDRL
jgi:hypothetical protein